MDFVRIGSVINNAADSFFTSEIRRRLFVTASLLVVSQIGYYVPLPGFDRRLIPLNYMSFTSGSIDGRLGYPQCAPYDAIHVGAAAPQIPQQLLDQLKPGGRLVIPVRNIAQDLKVVDKGLDESISIRSEASIRYVPLTSRDAQLQGF
ncbi:hypothetical protein QQ045_007807 [Rhodiola kirilowii]